MAMLMPASIITAPTMSSTRSRFVAGSRRRICATSVRSSSTRSVCVTVSTFVQLPEVGSLQLAGQLIRMSERDNLAMHHDRGVVRDAEHDTRKLLDDQDRHTFLRDLRNLLVQVLDHERREAHRQLVEEKHSRVGGQAP